LSLLKKTAHDSRSSLVTICQAWKGFQGSGPLAEVLASSRSERLDFNVTRCQYAELYKELGLHELGDLFHCNRDFAMVEGFSSNLTLKRTQTVMQGAGHCDFRFVRKDEGR